MAIAELLERILKESSIERPDGRPLYAYVAPTAVFEELRQAVARELGLGGNPQPSAAAGFCLAAARWLGNLEDRNATWERLCTEGLGIPTLAPLFREQLITRGLVYWQRSIIRLSTYRYLSTLIVEGGLAARLLAEPGNPLHAYVLDVLTDHERYPSQPLDEIARRHDGRLALGYRNSTVHDLVAGLVRAIAEARRAIAELPADDRDSLDRLDDRWRRLLPLSLADEAAASLIRNLMSVPRPSDETAIGIQAKTFLIETAAADDGERRFGIGRRLVGPLFLAGEALAPRSRSTPSLTSPNKLLLASDQAQVIAARLRKVYGGDRYRIEWTPDELRDDEAIGAVRGRVMSGDRRSHELEIDGCAALPDGPWYFRAEEGRRHLWLGAGSIQITDRTCLAAFPDDELGDAALRWQGGEPPQFVGRLTSRHVSRSVYLILGDGEWQTADDVYRIRLGSDRAVADGYELRGNHVDLGFDGSRVWLGQPKLCRRATDGVSLADVSSSELQWRPDRPGARWQPLSSACLGDVVLRHQVHGTTLYRKRLTVLPADFTLTFLTGERIVRLAGLTGVTITAGAAPYEVKVRPDELFVDVRVDLPPNASPSPLPLHLDFSQGRDARVTVTCPVDDVAVLDGAGRRAIFDRAMAPVPLSQLETLSLRARFTNGLPFHIEDQASPDVGDLADRGRREDRRGGFDCPLDVAFDHVAARLAAESDPERTIELRIKPSRQPARHVIRIGRAGGRPNCDSLADGVCRVALSDIQRQQPWFADDCRLVVERIFDPSISAPDGTVDASRSDEGIWLIRSDQLAEGPWLVTVEGSRGATTSPIRVFGTLPVERQAVSSLEQVVEIAHAQQRRTAMADLVDALIDDVEHSDWPTVGRVLERAMALPSKTFDLVGMLAERPRAAARVAVRMYDRPRLHRKFEELTFLWSVIGLEDWLDAIDAGVRSLAAGPAAALTKGWITALLERLPDISPGLRVLANLVANRFPELELHTEPWTEPTLLQHEASVEWARLTDTHPGRWNDVRFDLSTSSARAAEQFFDLDVDISKLPVLHGPLEAAGCAVERRWPTPKRMKQLIELRSFSPSWFERMHALALEWLLSRPT